MDKLLTFLVILFIVAVRGAQVLPPPCITMNALVKNSLQPDGITGSVLNDFTWVLAQCERSPADVNYDSNWVDASGDLRISSLPSSAMIARVQQRRLLKAHTNTDALSLMSLNITLDLLIDIKGEGFTLQAFAQMSKVFTSVPLQASTDLSVSWQGQLMTVSRTAMVDLSDLDLFDGSAPSFATEVSEPDATLAQNAAIALQYAGEVNLRIDHFSTSPSALPVSIRSFLPVKNLFNQTATFHMLGGRIAEVSGERGVLFQASVSCPGTSCPIPGPTGELLLSIVEHGRLGSKPTCRNPMIMAQSFSSQLSADIFVSHSKIVMRGVHAVTQAIVKCDNGFFGIELAANSAGPAVWPAIPFFSDSVTASMLTKSQVVVPHGHIFGSLTEDTQLYTMQRADLFEGTMGGVSLPDVELNTDAIIRLNDMFINVAEKLTTGIDVVDAKVRKAFPVVRADIDALVAAHSQLVQKPTRLSFLQFVFQNSPDVKMVVSTNGTAIILTFTAFTLQKTNTLPLTDASLKQLNSSMQVFSDKVKAKYSSQTASFVNPQLNKATAITVSQSASMGCVVAVYIPTGAQVEDAAPTNTNEVEWEYETVMPVTVSQTVAVHATFPATAVFTTIDSLIRYPVADLSITAATNPAVDSVPKSFMIDFSDPLLNVIETQEYKGTLSQLKDQIDQAAQTLNSRLYSEFTSGTLAPLDIDVRSIDGVTPPAATVQTHSMQIAKYKSQQSITQKGLNRLKLKLTSSINKQMTVSDKGVADQPGFQYPDLIRAFGKSCIPSSFEQDTIALSVQLQSCFANLLSSYTNRVLVSVRTFPTSDSSFRFNVSVDLMRNVAIVSQKQEWNYVFDVSRIFMPLALKSRLVFENTPGSDMVFTVKGGGATTGWCTPFLYNMVAARTHGEISATINWPGTDSVFMLTATASGVNIPSFLIDIENDQVGSKFEKHNFRMTLPPSISVPADQMYNALMVAMQTPTNVFRGPGALNQALPPFTQSIGDISNYTEWASLKQAWLAVPSTLDPVVVISDQIDSTTVTVPFWLNLTTNNNGVSSCHITSLSTQSLSALVDSLNSNLVSCGLGDILKSVSKPVEGSTVKGAVGFQAYAPGSLWLLKLDCDSAALTWTAMNNWQIPLLPAFGGWDDLSRLVSTLFHPEYRLAPVLRKIDGTQVEGLLRPDLYPFYSNLNGMFVSIDASYSQLHNAPVNTTNLSARQGQITVSLTPQSSAMFADGEMESGGAVMTRLHGLVGVCFDTPPQGFGELISLMSNLSDPDDWNKLVPAAPHNQFIIAADLEMRTKEEVVPMHFEVPITLTPGKHLFEAVQTDLPLQVNETLRMMLNISLIPPDFMSTASQVSIGIQRTFIDEQGVHVAVLMPTSLSFYGSTMTEFVNCSAIPSTSRILVDNLQIDSTLLHAVPLSAAQGQLGVLLIHNANPEQLKSNYTVNLHMRKSLQTLQATMQALQNRDTFEGACAAALFADHKIVIHDTAFNAKESELGSFHMNWAIAKELNITASVDLNSLTDKLQWAVDFSADDLVKHAIDSLVHMNTTSLCVWMNSAHITSGVISGHDLSKANLPWNQHSFSTVLNDVVGGALTVVLRKICDPSLPMMKLTIDTFCEVVQSVTGIPVCAIRKLDSVTFSVRLQFKLDKAWPSALQFSISNHFGKSTLPMGIGSEGDLAIQTSLDSDVTLTANIGNGHPLLTIGPALFTVNANADVTSNVKLWVGPIPLVFADMHAALAGTLTAKLDAPQSSLLMIAQREEILATSGAENGISVTANGNAFLKAGLQSDGHNLCDFSVKVPDIAQFLKDPSTVKGVDNCDGLDAVITKVQEAYSLLRYFMTTRFSSQLSLGIGNLMRNLFAPGGPLSKFLVPLVDNKISELVQKAIGSIVGPEITKDTSAALIHMANDILMKHEFHLNETDIEQLVLDGFTWVMCKYVPMIKSCPPAPRANQQHDYRWDLQLGKDETIFVKQLHFGLGKGAAFLGMDQCTAQLTMSWNFYFALHYTRQTGFALIFDHHPLFEAPVSLGLQGCEVDGKLGFIGAKLAAQATINGAISVDRTEAQNMLTSAQLKHPLHDLLYQNGNGAFQGNVKLDVSLTGLAELGFIWKGAKQLANGEYSNMEKLLNNQIMSLPSIPDVDSSPSYTKYNADTYTLTVNANEMDLEALPYFKASLSFTWAWDIHKGTTQDPKFQISDMKVCMGRILDKLIVGILQKIDHFTHPMQHVLGRNGILRKQIPAFGFLTGHDMNLAQFLQMVARHYGGGRFDGVFEAMQVFENILDLEDDLVGWIGGHLCDASYTVKPFAVEWDYEREAHANPADADPYDHLVFDPAVTVRDRERFTSATSKSVRVDGKFGFKFDFFTNIKENFVKLLMGQNIALFSVTIPSLTISVQHTMSFMVWPVPEVRINVGIGADLVVDIGAIIMTSNAAVRAFKSHNILTAFRGLAIPASYPNGSPRWPLHADAWVRGGVSVDICCFACVGGGGWVGVELRGAIRLADIDKDGFCTLDETMWLIKQNHGDLWASLDRDLKFQGGFGLFLEACISLGWFGHKCWRLVSKSWKATLWDWHFPPKVGDHMANPDGTINLGALDPLLLDLGPNAPSGGSISIYQDAGAISVDGLPTAEDSIGPRTVRIHPSSIQSRGNAGGPLKYTIQGINIPVTTPDLPSVSVFVPQQSYDTDTYSISTTHLSPGNAAGIRVSKCSDMHLTDAYPVTNIYMTGKPSGCTADIETTISGEVSVTGQQSDYAGGDVTVRGGTGAINMSLPSQRWDITSKRVTVEGGLNMNTPDALYKLRVKGHASAPTLYRLVDVPSDHAVEVNGGVADDLLLVERMELLTGMSVFDGGSGVNAIDEHMYTQTGGADIVAAQFSLTQRGTDGSNPHVLHWTNVQQRYMTVTHAAGAEPSQATLLTAESDAFISLVSQGAGSSSVMANYVSSCTNGADVRIALTEGGMQTVRFGSHGTLDGYECTVRITGSADPAQVDTIRIESPQDVRSLVWSVSQGALHMWNADKPMQTMLIHYSEIERLHIMFGQGGNEVRVTQSTAPTEMLFEFGDPSASKVKGVKAGSSLRNVLRLDSLAHPILVNGTVHELYIGTGQADPMNLMQAQIALVSRAQTVGVVHIEASGPSAAGMQYTMDDVCLNSQHSLPGAQPSTWMRTAMAANGFADTVRVCALQYIGLWSFVIQSGDQIDSFVGKDISVPLSLTMGGGNDQVELRGENIRAFTAQGVPALYVVDLGKGVDKITTLLPLSALQLSFGDDHDPDYLRMSYPTALFSKPPQLVDNVIAPIGLKTPTPTAVLSFVRAEDRIDILPSRVSLALGESISMKPVALTQVSTPAVAKLPVSMQPVLTTRDYISMYGADPIYFSSCDNKMERRLQMDAVGNHLVVIVPPGGASLPSLRCGVRVAGSNQQNKVDTLRIEAGAAASAITWKIGEGVIQLWDTYNSLNFFLIQFSQFERVHFAFSEGSDVTVLQSTSPTEMILSFPASAQPSSTVRIVDATYPVLINGSVSDVFVGAAQTANLYPVPMQYLRAQVAIASHAAVTTVHVESIGVRAQPMEYHMDSACFAWTGQATQRPPTGWMVQALAENGFSGAASLDCPIQYVGKLRWSIATGEGADKFVGKDVSVPVTLSLGGGDDEVQLSGENIGVIGEGVAPIYTIYLGKGKDKLAATLPSSGMVLSLGDDHDSDWVNIPYPKSMVPAPTIDGNVVKPLGWKSTPPPSMTLYEVHVEDSITLKSFDG